MQVEFGHNHLTADLTISTVSLSHTPDNLVRLFRCTQCGTPISQYRGAVIKIYPIVEPSSTVLVISRCNECGSLYTFQTQEVEKNVPVKVILHSNPVSLNTFRCVVCRIPLLKFDPEIVFDLVSQKKVELPYDMPCPTANCPYHYHFSEMV